MQQLKLIIITEGGSLYHPINMIMSYKLNHFNNYFFINIKHWKPQHTFEIFLCMSVS